MKKRVRIYQMGGVQALQNVGNVNTGPSDDDLISAAMTMIGEQDATPDDVLNSFVQNGVQPDRANQIVSNVISYINDQTELGNAQLADTEEREALEQEDMLAEQRAQEAADEERRQQMYNQMYYDQGEQDYDDDTEAVSDIIMRNGGNMPSKKKFIRNVMSLVKKQMGGDQPKPNSAYNDKNYGKQKSGLDSFVRSTQDSANNALMKQDAEAMYSSLQPFFQDGGDTESGVMDFDPYHNLAHYSDTFEHAMPLDETEMVQAQFGGMRPGQMRRMNRRINRMIGQYPAAMFNARQSMFPQSYNIFTLPMMGPQAYQMPASGSYQGGPRLANIDVRRTGLFGRPKEYTITFAQEAYTNPQVREEVIKQEANNVKTTIEDAKKDEKASKNNTSTSENKEVNKEAAKDKQTVVNPNPSASKNEKVISNPSVSQEQPVVSASPGYTPQSIREALEQRSIGTGTVKDVFQNQPSAPTTARSIYSNKNTSQDTYYYNPDKPGVNYVQRNGNWYYDDAKDTKQQWIKIDDPTRVSQLNTKLKGADIYTLPGKSGYYYRQRPDGSYAKFKGDPTKHTQSTKQIEVIKPGDKNYSYLNKNKEYSYSFSGKKQSGGFVDPNNPELYKFIYGGDELGIPDPGGKITDDPYFAYGGQYDLVQAQVGLQQVRGLSEALRDNEKGITSFAQGVNANDGNKKLYDYLKSQNLNLGDYREGIDYSKVNMNRGQGTQSNYNSGYYNPSAGAMYPPVFGARRRFGPPGGVIGYAGSWAQQQGQAFNPMTGQPITNMPGNMPLSKMEVTKTGLFGRPKEYTMYYGNYAKPGTDASKTATTTPGKTEPEEEPRRKSRLMEIIRAKRTPFTAPDEDVSKPQSSSITPLPNERESVQISPSPWGYKKGQPLNFPEKTPPMSDQDKISKWEKERNYKRDGRGYSYTDPETGATQKGTIPEIYAGSGSTNFHPALGFYAYGGYLPQAQMGVFTSNPDMVGLSDIDLLESQTAPKVQGATSLMGDWSSSMPGTNQPTIQETGAKQPEEITIDPNQPNRATVKKELDPNSGAAVKYKVKDMYNVDFEKGVNQFNTGVNMALAMFGERGDKKRLTDMQNNLTADNLYGNTNIQNRGTYDTNSGLFRPDEMGFKGVVRDGGYMQEGGDMYDEDDVTWMSEEQIRQFLADGGELEFIQE